MFPFRKTALKDRALVECMCVYECVCWQLQVGYLYDRLLMDCLSLHNGKKGYLSVCESDGERG